MPGPFAILFGGFILIWTIGVITGLAYLRGGPDAVRRVAPRVAILVPILVGVLLVLSIVTSKVGSMTVALVLLPVLLVRWAFVIRRFRHVRAGADAASAPTPWTPPIRKFAIIALVVMLAGSIVLAYVSSRVGL